MTLAVVVAFWFLLVADMVLKPFSKRADGRRPDGSPFAFATSSRATRPSAGRNWPFRAGSVEATTGVEPVNSGFADRRVRPLRHVAAVIRRSGYGGCLAAPRGFEPRFTDPKSAVLPLDEGAAPRPGQRNGAEDGTRTRDPHLGKVMLYQLSHFRPFNFDHQMVVPRARIELATPRFSVACSTN